MTGTRRACICAISAARSAAVALAPMSQCAARPRAQTDKQINGRVTLSGVALDAIAPKAISAGLTGTLDASAEFSGSGETLGQAIEALSGTGSYTINGFSAAHFDPGVFTSLDGLTDVVDTPPETLTQAVTESSAPGRSRRRASPAAFTIAGRHAALAEPGDRRRRGADFRWRESGAERPDARCALRDVADRRRSATRA